MTKVLKKRVSLKVSPDAESQKMSKEEAAEMELERQKKEAEGWMNEKMRRKLLQPYRIQAGLVPQVVTNCLPTPLTGMSGLGFLFGKSSPKDLKGPPAAAIRLANLNINAVKTIKRRFDKIDNLDEGKISSLEFMEFVQLEDTAFARELIESILLGIADLTDKAVMEFPAFVLATVLICTFSRDQIMFRVFQIFDADGSGFLDVAEMHKLGEAVNAMGTGVDFKKKVAQLNSNSDLGVLDFTDFKKLNLSFPLLFYPVFKLQDLLRKKTLGASTWRRMVDKWDAAEKKRALLLGVDPEALSDQLTSLNDWFEEQKALKAGGRSTKLKGAGFAVMAGKKETTEQKLQRLGRVPPGGGFKPPGERKKASKLTKEDKVALTLARGATTK
mmetsp:Transcript_54835/g.102764  ORF Transcript_54835/g.102764 Transcript_54835/m.102764 type:complete len:386 (-) Transcript_54835:170-1327(-)